MGTGCISPVAGRRLMAALAAAPRCFARDVRYRSKSRRRAADLVTIVLAKKHGAVQQGVAVCRLARASGVEDLRDRKVRSSGNPQCAGQPRVSLLCRSPFPSGSGSRAMLMAMRRASSFVSTFACIASASVARLYPYAIACPLASRTAYPPGILSARRVIRLPSEMHRPKIRGSHSALLKSLPETSLLPQDRGADP
jgi:hypothetical protein